MNTTLITEEQKYLDKTVKVIDSLLDQTEDEMKKEVTSQVEASLQEIKHKQIKKLNEARKSPYFGRLDFEDDYGEETIYIGKKVLMMMGILLL